MTRRIGAASAADSGRRNFPGITGRHVAGGEIGDIHDLINRLERFSEAGGIADTPPHADLSRSPPRTPQLRVPDPAEPISLGIWSGRETRRFLETLGSLRACAETVSGSEALPAGIAQWLGAPDRIVTAADARLYELAAAALANDASGRPAVVETGPVAALEAAIAARATEAPDLSVADLGPSNSIATGVRDAFAVAMRHRLPILFVARSNADRSAGADFPAASPVGRVADNCGMETGIVDGTDIVSVSEGAGELIHHIRCTGGPGYLEAAISDRLEHDPLTRLRSAMVARGDVSDEQAAAILDPTRG